MYEANECNGMLRILSNVVQQDVITRSVDIWKHKIIYWYWENSKFNYTGQNYILYKNIHVHTCVCIEYTLD